MGLPDNPLSAHLFFFDLDVPELREKLRDKPLKHHKGFVFKNFDLIDKPSVFVNGEPGKTENY